MAKRIVFLDEYSVDKADLTQIKILGDYTGYEMTQPEQVVERCKGAEIAITNKTRFTAEIIAALPDLKLICVAATGMNNIDLEAAESAGISVRNAVGYSTYSVAEQTFSGVLALLKQVVYFDAYVKDGSYASSSYLCDFTRPTYELHGKKWGVIGLGNIGKQVAKIA